MMETGEHMRRARLKLGWNQRTLSQKSGVPIRSIENYEIGSNAPGLVNLLALSDALGISIDEYVGHRIGGKNK